MIYHNKPTLGEDEIQASHRVLKSGWIAQGKEVEKFEDEFCKYIGLAKGHSIAVSSGTAALYLALRGINVENENVHLPSYGCTAIKNAVTLAKGNPVFIDCCLESPNMNLESLDLEKDITMAVHTYGYPVSLELTMANNPIEDCCQSLGTMESGKSLGLKGRFGVFSFFATKIITSGGQGGMVISNSKEDIDRLKDLRDFDMKNDSTQRFNFQMTDLQAAIGRIQLSKLDSFIKKRKEIFKLYTENNISIIHPKNCSWNYFRALVEVDDPSLAITKFKENGINVINPLTEKELLFPQKNSIIHSRKYISLPIYPELNEDQVEKIINTFKRSI